MLARLEFDHIRSYSKVRIDIDSPITVLVGKNGTGKTTVLEGASILGSLRSFKTSRIQDVYANEHPTGMNLLGMFKDQAFQSVQVNYSQRSKKCMIDGEKTATTTEFLGAFIPVILSPELHGLITEGPEDRRRYLDTLLFSQDHYYWDIFTNYKKSLRQKQHLLSQDMSAAEYLDLVRPWNLQIIQYGKEIRRRRQDLVQCLQPLVYQHYQHICAQADDCRLEYPYSHEQMEEEVKKNELREYHAKRALVGPHRDDLNIFIAKFLAKSNASQGEKTTVLLALKFSELDLVFKFQPQILKILLLDDLGITLDAYRREKLFRKIEDLKIQTMIATADDDITHRVKEIGGKSYQREDYHELGISFARWAPKC